MRALLLSLMLMHFTVATAVAGTPVPSLAVRTLTGEPMQLPAALPDRPVLLIVGFTRASRAQVATWTRCLRWDGADRPQVAIFRVVVIEDVPKPFRNAAIRSIQKSVPDAMRTRFLLVTEQAVRWKALTGFTQADAAYLMLLDPDREVAWRHQGTASDAACQGLQAAIDEQPTR